MKLQDWTVKPDYNSGLPLTATNFPLYDPAGHVVLKALVRLNDLPPGLIRYGDKIQFNGQGPWYEIWRDPRPDA